MEARNPVRAIGLWLAIVFDRLERARERRHAHRQLARLDDRGLADLGMGRCEIERAVNGPYSEPLGDVQPRQGFGQIVAEMRSLSDQRHPWRQAFE